MKLASKDAASLEEPRTSRDRAELGREKGRSLVVTVCFLQVRWILLESDDSVVWSSLARCAKGAMTVQDEELERAERCEMRGLFNIVDDAGSRRFGWLAAVYWRAQRGESAEGVSEGRKDQSSALRLRRAWWRMGRGMTYGDPGTWSLWDGLQRCLSSSGEWECSTCVVVVEGWMGLLLSINHDGVNRAVQVSAMTVSSSGAIELMGLICHSGYCR